MVGSTYAHSHRGTEIDRGDYMYLQTVVWPLEEIPREEAKQETKPIWFLSTCTRNSKADFRFKTASSAKSTHATGFLGQQRKEQLIWRGSSFMELGASIAPGGFGTNHQRICTEQHHRSYIYASMHLRMCVEVSIGHGDALIMRTPRPS